MTLTKLGVGRDGVAFEPTRSMINGSDAISIAIRRLREGSRGHEVIGTCGNGHRSGRWSVHTFTVHTAGSTALIGVLHCPPHGGPLICFTDALDHFLGASMSQ